MHQRTNTIFHKEEIIMIKKHISKLLALLLVATTCLSFSTPIYASESQSNTIETYSINNEFSLDCTSLSEAEIEYIENLMFREYKSGDIIILKESLFETFYVEVFDDTTADEDGIMPVSSYVTETKKFVFAKTVLGVKQQLFSVKLTCYWIDNGQNSSIINLKGTYSIIAAGVTCSWDPTYSFSSDFLHTICLDYTYNYGRSNGALIIGASLSEIIPAFISYDIIPV